MRLRSLFSSCNRDAILTTCICCADHAVGLSGRLRGIPRAPRGSERESVPRSRLTRQQRMEAIEGPLGQTKIVLSLAQRILNDAGDEPDRLPLLQHVLMRTWSQWQKSDPEQTRSIDLKDYLHPSVGGLENALDRHAKELLKDVPRRLRRRSSNA